MRPAWHIITILATHQMKPLNRKLQVAADTFLKKRRLINSETKSNRQIPPDNIGTANGLFQDCATDHGQRGRAKLEMSEQMGIQSEWESPESHAGHC